MTNENRSVALREELEISWFTSSAERLKSTEFFRSSGSNAHPPHHYYLRCHIRRGAIAFDYEDYFRRLATSSVQLVYWLARTIYDVYFGPLSHIPGPKLAAATRLVFSYHKVTGRLESWMMQLHEQYGDVVRPAPGEVSLASGKEWRTIYGQATGSRFANMAKDPTFYFKLREDESVAVINGDTDHARQRKAFTPAFTDRALAEQEPLIQRYINKLVSNLSKIDPNSKTDMVKQFNFTTFDTMADLMFGEPLGCLENSQYTEWVGMIFDGLRIFAPMMELNRIPYFNNVMEAIFPPPLKKKRDSHFQHSVDRVNKRLADQNPRPDILGLVTRENVKDSMQLSPGEIYANGQLFMIAGTETSATLLSGLTYYLLTNTEKLTKLTQEIRAAFLTSVEIHAAVLQKLPYMNACIKEALRIYPPVPVGLPRRVGKPGAELDGYFLPENTCVYIHMMSTYHNPKNFARPKSFVPERWLLDDLPAEFVNDDRSCHQPFSIGPRNCLGMNLAWMEIRLILAHILYNFDMQICDESRNWTDQKIFMLWDKGPLMVTLKPVRE